MSIIVPARLSEANVLPEEDLAAIAGGAWNWGGMFLGGLQGAVYTGLGTAAQAAYLGQPVGSAGIGGMVAGGVAGALQGGQLH